MSGDQMRVDYDRLGDLERNLETAVRVVGSELGTMAGLASAVGDQTLSQRTNSFRDSWDKRRLDIVDSLDWLRGSIQNIRTQLAETDQSLATGIQAPAAATGSPNTPRAV